MTTSPLRRAPIQARAKERIERVLDAAAAVFAEVGFETATTNLIATRADTSIGSIYEFFGNKQAVAKALADRYLAELGILEIEAQDDDPTGLAGIVSMVDALDRFTRDHPGLGPLLRGCRGSSDLEAAGVALQATLVEGVERIIRTRWATAAPDRRRLVAEICGDVLRCILDDSALRPEVDRATKVAELKVMLTSYLAAALSAG